MNEINTFGVTELSADELVALMGGKISVMWVLGYVYQTIVDLPAPDETILRRVY